jgi:hypothetical protein
MPERRVDTEDRVVPQRKEPDWEKLGFGNRWEASQRS